MFLVKRIVVGVEMPAERPWNRSSLKPSSRVAVRQAFQVASGRRIPVTLVSILPEPGAGSFHSHEASRQMIQDRAAADVVLNELKQEYSSDEKSQDSIECVVRAGDAWAELIRLAGNQPDTLILCGTRDPDSLRRGLFGSTGLKLLRLAPGPVWIVRPPLEDKETIDIVAATDLGSVGADVIQTAVSIASKCSARLHVVHAARNEADTEVVKGRVHEQLAASDYRTIPAGARVYVAAGEADQCILDHVREANADLVVLGTSSNAGTSGLLPGSTVERLLPELQCSILAIKPEGFQSMLPADFWTMDLDHREDLGTAPRFSPV